MDSGSLFFPIGIAYWATPVFIYFWGRKLRREGRRLGGQIGGALALWFALTFVAFIVALLCAGGHGCGLIGWLFGITTAGVYVWIFLLLRSASRAPIESSVESPKAGGST